MPRPMVCVILALAPLMATALRSRDIGEDPVNVSDPKCGLDKVPKFLLNLDRRPERRAGFESRLQATAPWMLENMCRVRAPDGKTFGHSLPPSLVDQTVWHRVFEEKGSGRLVRDEASSGVLACHMGHALIWEHILQADAPWSIVFEDDVGRLHPGVGDFLCRVLKGKEGALRDGWEWVQMQLPPRFRRDDASPVHAVPGTDFHTGMYLITKEAAARMLNLSFPLGNHQLDSSKGVLRNKLKGFMTQPKAAEQMGGVRDTDAQLTFDRLKSHGMKNCTHLVASRMVVPELLHALG